MSVPSVTTMKQFEALLVSWLAGLLPAVPAVWEDQNAPRPTTGQYLSLYGPRVVSETEAAEYGESLDADDDTLIVVSADEQIAIYVTVTVHSDATDMTAQDRANWLRRTIKQLPARMALEPLAVVNTEPVIQVPQLLESQFENRFQFVVQFRLGMQDQFRIEAVEEVQGTGTLTRGAAPSVSVPIATDIIGA